MPFPATPTPEISQVQGWCSAIPHPTPPSSPPPPHLPRGRAIGEGWVPGPNHPYFPPPGLQTPVPGPGPMNPRPKHATSRPSDGGGVVWGGTGRDPSLPAIQLSPAFPGALNWVLVPPCLPRPRWGRASALPSQVRPQPALVPYLSELSFLELLHLGGQVAGASRLVFPSAQRAGSERENGRCAAGQRRAFAPAAPCTGFGGASAGAAVCRLRVRGAERSCERQSLSTQGRRLGRGARLRPRRHPNGQTAEGYGWGDARPLAQS